MIDRDGQVFTIPLPAALRTGRVDCEGQQRTVEQIELIHPPFRIVYRRGAAHIQVIRVWRSERLLEPPRGSE